MHELLRAPMACRACHACQAGDTSDLCVPIQAVSLAVPVAFPGPSLIFMMVYVWSRNFPNNNISLMGLVRTPFLCLLLEYLLT